MHKLVLHRRLQLDLHVRGRIPDRVRVTPDPNGIRRLAHPQNLPVAVRQLLRVDFLHRFFQGQVYRLPETLQQDFRIQTRGVRTRRLFDGAVHPVGDHHDRKTSDEHSFGNALSTVLQMAEHFKSKDWLEQGLYVL